MRAGKPGALAGSALPRMPGPAGQRGAPASPRCAPPSALGGSASRRGGGSLQIPAATATGAAEVDQRKAGARLHWWPLKPEEKQAIAAQQAALQDRIVQSVEQLPAVTDVVADNRAVTTARPGGSRASGRFLRRKGVAAPGLVAASLLDAALLVFASEEERAARRSLAAAQQWIPRRKYEAFGELLLASPALQEPRFAPLAVLLDEAPRFGAERRDFLRALLGGMTDADSPTSGLVTELLLRGRAQAVAQPGAEDLVAKHDVVLALVRRTLLHADWQLGDESAADSADESADDWEGASPYDPVAWVFENVSASKAKYKWDPLVAAFAAQAPTARPAWDPLQAALAAQPPASSPSDPLKGLLRAQPPSGSTGWLDPLRSLLQASPPASSPSDPLKGLLRAQPPARRAGGGWDPLAALLASEAPGRRVQSEPARDILRGLLAADPRSQQDPAADLPQGAAASGLPEASGKTARSLGGALASIGRSLSSAGRKQAPAPSPTAAAAAPPPPAVAAARPTAARLTPAAPPASAKQPDAAASARPVPGKQPAAAPTQQQQQQQQAAAAQRAEPAPAQPKPAPMRASIRAPDRVAPAKRQQQRPQQQQPQQQKQWQRLAGYDLVPDLLRLERAGASLPLAGADALAVLSRRGGSSTDVAEVAAAFRELVGELKMTGQLRTLRPLLDSPAAAQAQGAQRQQEAALQLVLTHTEGRPRLQPLHRLLRGHSPATAASAVQALQAITLR